MALAAVYTASGQTQRASDALAVAERIAEREGDPVELGLTRWGAGHGSLHRRPRRDRQLR